MTTQQVQIIGQALRQFSVWMSDEQVTLLLQMLAARGLVVTEKPRD
jgi:hypothetical protein